MTAGDRPSSPQDESRRHQGGAGLAADVFHGERAGDEADSPSAAVLAGSTLPFQSMADVSHGERAGTSAGPAGAPAPRKAGSTKSMADVSLGERAGPSAGPAGAPAPRQAGSLQTFEAAADGQPPNLPLAPTTTTTPLFPPPLKEIAIKADISERALLLCDVEEFKELLQDLGIPIRERLRLKALHADLLIAASDPAGGLESEPEPVPEIDLDLEPAPAPEPAPEPVPTPTPADDDGSGPLGLQLDPEAEAAEAEAFAGFEAGAIAGSLAPQAGHITVRHTHAPALDAAQEISDIEASPLAMGGRPPLAAQPTAAALLSVHNPPAPAPTPAALPPSTLSPLLEAPEPASTPSSAGSTPTAASSGGPATTEESQFDPSWSLDQCQTALRGRGLPVSGNLSVVQARLLGTILPLAQIKKAALVTDLERTITLLGGSAADISGKTLPKTQLVTMATELVRAHATAASATVSALRPPFNNT